MLRRGPYKGQSDGSGTVTRHTRLLVCTKCRGEPTLAHQVKESLRYIRLYLHTYIPTYGIYLHTYVLYLHTCE